ncbi:Uncharacterised protein [Vibrio cholerae]|nr:Uncharacterised protein [Vibrio cholerae]
MLPQWPQVFLNYEVRDDQTHRALSYRASIYPVIARQNGGVSPYMSA